MKLAALLQRMFSPFNCFFLALACSIETSTISIGWNLIWIENNYEISFSLEISKSTYYRL